MAKKKTTLTEEQQALYRREVERVNKQLYRLRIAYKDRPDKLMETAYAKMMRDIKSEFGEQKTFGRSIPENLNVFRSRLNMIRDFYSKPSATLSGLRNVYEKRAATLSEMIGQKFSADDLKNFFDTGIYKALEDRFGSAKAMKYWKTIEKQKGRIAEQLREGKKISFRGRIAKDLNVYIHQEAQSEFGVEFDELLRGYILGEE